MIQKNLIIVTIIGVVLMGLIYMSRDKIVQWYKVSSFSSEKYSSPEFSRSLNYRLYIPKNREPDKLPLVVFFHQYGNNGDNNKDQINHIVYPWVGKQSQSEFPCYILAPQCPAGKEWVDKNPSNTRPYKHYSLDEYSETEEMKMTVKVINQIVERYEVDESRIYVVGFSMGATGCWDALCRNPNLFSASVIASGVSDTTKASSLINIPIWAFTGEKDRIAPAILNQQMVKAINNSGGKAKFHLVEGEGHDIGSQVINSEKVKQWLFSQKKD